MDRVREVYPVRLRRSQNGRPALYDLSRRWQFLGVSTGDAKFVEELVKK